MSDTSNLDQTHPEGIAALRQRADQASVLERQLEERERTIAFLQAGVDLTSRPGQILLRGYDGAVSMKEEDLAGITQAAKDLNALRISAALQAQTEGGQPVTGTAAEGGAAEGQPVSDLARLAQTRAALATEGIPAGIVGQEKLHPAALSQLAFREKMTQGMDERAAAAQAVQGYIGAFFSPGVYQDSVTWNGWTPEQLADDKGEFDEYRRNSGSSRLMQFGSDMPHLVPEARSVATETSVEGSRATKAVKA